MDRYLYKAKNVISLIVILLYFQSCDKNIDTPIIGTQPITKSQTYCACTDIGSDEYLEISSWNIEHFPKANNTTLEVQSIISNSEYDLWGLQEIETESALKGISQVDDKYNVLIDSDIVSGINNNYHLAFVYRNDKLELTEQGVLLLNSYYFPRRPLLAKFKRKSDNSTFYVINIHLKCCGGSENELRRVGAAEEIKKYIDDNLSTSKVIVLGDFNDVIYPYSESEFKIIIDDDNNYSFADMELAMSNCSSCDFSYPSWPSHIDHLLVTNELFGKLEEIKVLNLNKCSSSYDEEVSDHRPVVAVFN